MAAMANMAVPVRAAAVKQDIDIYLKSLGTVTAYSTVTVRSRVSGELVDVPFKEGQMVKAGDLLAQVDPRAFQVALAQAQGTQMQNLAQLENARRDLQRYQALYKQDSIAKQQVDTQAALVRQYEGAVKSDQANVDNAKLQLDYSRITAPISGRLGLRQVDKGNLVSSSDTNGLVVITQTQPISVVFTLPETQLPEVRAELAAGHTLTVEAYDRADTRRIATGKLETLDNQIDVATGTLKLKARFDNADDALFPNQFVNARLHVTTRRTPPRFPSRRCSRARPALSSSWSRTTIRWPCGRSSWAPSTTAWWRSTRACSPATGRDRGHRPPARGAKVDVAKGSDTIPKSTDKSLGAGAPAGTTPATR